MTKFEAALEANTRLQTDLHEVMCTNCKLRCMVSCEELEDVGGDEIRCSWCRIEANKKGGR